MVLIVSEELARKLVSVEDAIEAVEQFGGGGHDGSVGIRRAS